MIFEGRFQIGKNGITPGIIQALNSNLKTHTQLRISVLKSVERNKNKIKEMAKELSDRTEYPCNYRIIGFTIILRKQSRNKKHK